MGDLERYDERRSVSERNIKVLQVMVTEIAAQSQRLAEVEDRLNAIATKAAVDKEWMELRAFCSRYEVSPLLDMSDHTLGRLGQHIARWHERLSLPYISASKNRREAAFHERYGAVSKYRRDLLARYFREAGYSFDEELFADDGC